MKLKLPCPLPGKPVIVSPFGGVRTLTINGETTTRRHNGIDLRAAVGTDIRAVGEGLVVHSGWEVPTNPKAGYGLYLKHRFVYEGKAFYAYYGHCNELLVKVNERVKAGQLIAKSGKTGRVEGPHLHFGAREENTDEFYDVEFPGA